MTFKGFYYETSNTILFSTEPPFSIIKSTKMFQPMARYNKFQKQFINLTSLYSKVIVFPTKTKKISNQIFNKCDSQSILFSGKGKGNIVCEFGKH